LVRLVVSSLDLLANLEVTVHAPSRRIGPVGPFPTVWDQSSLAT
jgi:hypothetical protein